ncbi:hypothetical protein C0V80_05790 [Leuconostoc pseudomesenteroides]|nr:hypothetical protein [Leuconostoc pseudomesenteroides]
MFYRKQQTKRANAPTHLPLQWRGCLHDNLFQELTQLFNAICVTIVMFAIKRYFDDWDGR